jgi:hypothetical protein
VTAAQYGSATLSSTAVLDSGALPSHECVLSLDINLLPTHILQHFMTF